MAARKIAIVGGGAAGITAAIAAARTGADVTLYDRMPRLGKKVLASGAGRCNLLNERLDPSFYNEEAYEIVAGIFSRFGKDNILNFFRELGLFTYAEPDGRIFPRTNHALSVMEALEGELTRLGVTREISVTVKKVRTESLGFELTLSNGKTAHAEKVILATGGKSYPALGSDGGGFEIAAALGHHIIETVPATVPLVAHDAWCHPLQGVKIRGRACAVIDAKELEWIEGDILFTQYGLSGTAILDISDPVSAALNRHPAKKVTVLADFVPFLSEAELKSELQRRAGLGLRGIALLTGLVHPKLAALLERREAAKPIPELCRILKHREFAITGTRGWNEAEFTAGGVDCREINPETLESLKHKGLYFAGEILDINGRRGGYQLAFAWASGYLTGLAASGS